MYTIVAKAMKLSDDDDFLLHRQAKIKSQDLVEFLLSFREGSHFRILCVGCIELQDQICNIGVIIIHRILGLISGRKNTEGVEK